MAETRSHNDDLTVTLNKGTTLLNYVPPYIVTEKKNITQSETSASGTKKLHNEVTTPHHDVNI